MKIPRRLLFLLILLVLATGITRAQTSTYSLCAGSTSAGGIPITGRGETLIVNVTQITGFTAAPQIFLTYTMVLTDGNTFEFQNTFNGANQAAGSNYSFPIPEAGCLIHITLVQQIGVQRGQYLLQVFFGKTIWPIYNSSRACLLQTTMAGFQTVSASAGTFGCAMQANDGPGSLLSYTVSNPSSGAASWTTTFTSGVRNQLIGIRFVYTASSTTGTRGPVTCTFTDAGGHTFASKEFYGTQALNTAVTYNLAVGVGTDLPFAASLPALTTGSDVMAPLPFGLAWNDATVVTCTIVSPVAGDQWSAIVLRTQSWNEID